MQSNTFEVVTVILQDRDDDGLFVYSDDLPGLILAGKDKHAVCECIAPAIKALYEHQGLQVEVRSEVPFADALATKSPRKVDMHVQRFIVELKRAASPVAWIGMEPQQAADLASLMLKHAREAARGSGQHVSFTIGG